MSGFDPQSFQTKAYINMKLEGELQGDFAVASDRRLKVRFSGSGLPWWKYASCGNPYGCAAGP